MTPAQRAMASAPSAAAIRRVTEAMLPQAIPAPLATGEYRGWRFIMRPSIFNAGQVSAWARRGDRECCTEVATLDEAREWLREIAA